MTLFVHQRAPTSVTLSQLNLITEFKRCLSEKSSVHSCNTMSTEMDAKSLLIRQKWKQQTQTNSSREKSSVVKDLNHENPQVLKEH